MGAKEANKRRPEGQVEWAHAARFLGRVGPINRGLEAPLPSIFFPEPPSCPKTTIKIVPRRLSEGSAAETQNHETEDLELQIGGGKLRWGAAGVVSIFYNISTIITMMKGE